MPLRPWRGGLPSSSGGGLSGQGSCGDSGPTGDSSETVEYIAGAGAVGGAAYVAASAACFVGDVVVSSIFPGVPGGDAPLRFWISTGIFLYLFFFLLFCLCLYGLIKLIASLPLRPSWESHARFNKRMRFCPYVVLTVLYITNTELFATRLIDVLYTHRMFASYIAALFGTAYVIVYSATVPPGFPHAHERFASSGVPDVGYSRLVDSRPVARYVLSLLGFVSVSISTWLTLLLFPNSFARAPRDWWQIFVPNF